MRLGVIGIGTAGIVSLCSIIRYVSNDWDIVSIYDPEQKILGIGESTNPNFVDLIQESLNFIITEDLNELDGTLKLGTIYKQWREHSWINPLFGAGVAIHFNNYKLKEFAFRKLKQIYPKKFKILEGKVKNLYSTSTKAIVDINGEKEEFDWIIDCRGWPDNFDDYVISDCSPVNHCLVYDKEPWSKELSTEHIATEHGWTFGIPLTTRHTYGYLFNDSINSKEEAIIGFESLLGEKIDLTKLGEYKFTSYYSKNVLDKRILKNGNRALFFEPLSASSIFVYISLLSMFLQHLERKTISNPYDNGGNFNQKFIEMANDLEDMLSFLYHGGSIHKTKFWEYASNKGKVRLENSKTFNEIKQEYKQNYEKGYLCIGKSWFFRPISLRLIDEQMKYFYFKE